MQSLHEDDIKSILFTLPFPDVINYCASSKDIKDICDNTTFWKERALRDFGVPLVEIVDFTDQQNYLYMLYERRGDIPRMLELATSNVNSFMEVVERNVHNEVDGRIAMYLTKEMDFNDHDMIPYGDNSLYKSRKANVIDLNEYFRMPQPYREFMIRYINDEYTHGEKMDEMLYYIPNDLLPYYVSLSHGNLARYVISAIKIGQPNKMQLALEMYPERAKEVGNKFTLGYSPYQRELFRSMF